MAFRDFKSFSPVASAPEGKDEKKYEFKVWAAEKKELSPADILTTIDPKEIKAAEKRIPAEWLPIINDYRFQERMVQAAEAGDLAMICFLQSRGVDPNAPLLDDSLSTGRPLKNTIGQQQWKAVFLLLQLGAHADAKDIALLMRNNFSSDLPLFPILLRELQRAGGRFPAEWFERAYSGMPLESFQYLTKQDIEFQDNMRMNILHYACAGGNLAAVKIIYDQYLKYAINLHINPFEEYIFPPLFTAVNHNQIEIVRFLIEEKQVDVNLTSRANLTLLHVASSLEMIMLLVSLGRQLNNVRHLVRYPHRLLFHYYWNQKYPSLELPAMIKYLIECGMNPDELDNGNSFFYNLVSCPDTTTAQKEIYQEMKDVVVAYADRKHADSLGDTLLHKVVKNNSLTDAIYLLTRGWAVNLNQQNNDFCTPLYYAQTPAMGDLLVKYGARVSATDQSPILNVQNIAMLQWYMSHNLDVNAKERDTGNSLLKIHAYKNSRLLCEMISENVNISVDDFLWITQQTFNAPQSSDLLVSFTLCLYQFFLSGGLQQLLKSKQVSDKKSITEMNRQIAAILSHKTTHYTPLIQGILADAQLDHRRAEALYALALKEKCDNTEHELIRNMACFIYKYKALKEAEKSLPNYQAINHAMQLSVQCVAGAPLFESFFLRMVKKVENILLADVLSTEQMAQLTKLRKLHKLQEYRDKFKTVISSAESKAMPILCGMLTRELTEMKHRNIAPEIDKMSYEEQLRLKKTLENLEQKRTNEKLQYLQPLLVTILKYIPISAEFSGREHLEFSQYIFDYYADLEMDFFGGMSVALMHLQKAKAKVGNPGLRQQVLQFEAMINREIELATQEEKSKPFVSAAKVSAMTFIKSDAPSALSAEPVSLRSGRSAPR